MKKSILSVCLALTALCSANAKDYKYQTVQGDPMQARIYTLDNGLKVYLSVNKEKPRATAYIAVNTGSHNDPAECTGLAHYLEHLMFKGTKKFGTSDYNAERPYLDKISDLYEEYRKLTDPQARKAKYHEIDSVSQIAAKYNIPNEYDKMMAAFGGEGSNAYTSYDVTCYTEDIPSNEIECWAELQADRFQNMIIRGFHTELEAVYEEKNISLSNDVRKVFNAMMAKLYPSHSYGLQTTLGTQDHLKNPSLVEISKYYNRYYKPNNIAICMAGDFDFDEVISIIDKNFGSWQPGSDISPRQFPKQPIFTAVQDTTVVGQEMEQVFLGWRFDGAASLQADTLSLISNILYNGSCGLIDLDVNQKMEVLSAYAGNMTLKEYSTFMLSGAPKEGQTLEQVRDIILSEIKKLKAGDFDEDLIISIVNNKKRQYLEEMGENDGRVNIMVDAFINGESWQNQVYKLDRMSKITKTDIVTFANKYLADNYVCAYKLKGEDTNIKKIEKPAITPIPSNRDMASDFLTQLTSRKVKPILPHFVNYDTDLTKSETKTKLPILYVQNKENELFKLTYRYEFGDRADVRYSVLNNYIPLLGTSKMSNEEIQKQFYKLACDYSIQVSNDNITITLSGLSENMKSAMNLLEQVLNDTKADKDVYNLYIENELKSREEAKKDQETCFSYLWQYGLHGAKNDNTNILSEEELKNTDPTVFTDLLKRLASYKHTLLYYGPYSVDELAATAKSIHKTAKKLNDVPQNKEWEWTQTPTSEIYIAPYEANNIYMSMLNNDGKSLDFSRMPVINLFNEYFGAGMNTVVFQELRETRGLAYHASAVYRTPSRKQDTEYWMEQIISQNDKMMDCINTFKLITDTMPLTPSAFDIAKASMMKSLSTARTTKFGIIDSYINAQRLGINYSLSKTIYDALPSLTMQDIVNFEQQNIKGKPLHYVILGDEKELDMPALEKIAPVKRVTLEDIFGY